MNWAVASDTFPRVAKILAAEHDFFARSIAAGLVVSVGGLTESVVKHAGAALVDWCKNQVSEGKGMISSGKKDGGRKTRMRTYICCS